MTTKHKSPTSWSFIHTRLSEVNGASRASRALSTIPFTISVKGPKLFHKHQSTKGYEQQNWHILEAQAEQRNIHVPNMKQYDEYMNIHNIQSNR
ncbi:hypothetical protein B296_00014577 [Ensete ventricosum]|uniref:Uncharacterized protein n=1 Tax=Ensete ventricosum TaxID=4639 RepID=A0A426XYZ6_ENSVE|nr:hypothetical protein B296_00014577 [Ensete ventricosum]